MSFIVPMEKPKRCGLCPCFHAEHPMHCQAVKAHKDKRIIAPYGAPIPDWCPLIECRESLFSAKNAGKFLMENPPKEGETWYRKAYTDTLKAVFMKLSELPYIQKHKMLW